MISREALRRLAEFRADDESALSFYFQPTTPADKSHREEAILIKDMVRNARAEGRKNGRSVSDGDFGRLLALADRLDGNHSRA